MEKLHDILLSLISESETTITLSELANLAKEDIKEVARMLQIMVDNQEIKKEIIENVAYYSSYEQYEDIKLNLEDKNYKYQEEGISEEKSLELLSLDQQKEELKELEKTVSNYKKVNAEYDANSKQILNALNMYLTKRTKIIDSYQTEFKKDEEFVNKHEFNGENDILVVECIDKLKNDINTMGDAIVDLVNEAYNYVVRNSKFVEKEVLVRYVEFLKESYEIIIDTVIDNPKLNTIIKYRIDINDYPGYSATKDMVEIFGKQKERDKHEEEIKAYNRLKEAVNYNVLLKELDSHKAYLNALEMAKKAYKYQDYLDVIKAFEEVEGYLDSNDYLDKFNEKAKQEYIAKYLDDDILKLRKKIEKLEKEVDKISSDIVTTQVIITNKGQELEALKNTQVIIDDTELNKLNESLLELSSKMDSLEKEKEELNHDLNKAAFFAFNLKKELKSKISVNQLTIETLNQDIKDVEAKISSAEDSIDEANIQHQEAIKDKERELNDARQLLKDLNDTRTIMTKSLKDSRYKLEVLEANQA